MRKMLTLLVMVMLLVVGQVTEAANIKDYPTVAVMNFGNKAVMSQGLRDTDFSAATEYAIYQLSACGWFDLVDYEQLSTIAKMHRVNMSGLIDPSTTVQIGKFAGAKFIVVGNLTGLTTKESMLGIQAGHKGSIGGNKHTVIANVSMRITDIETGRIVVAGLGKGESASTNMEVVFKKYRRNKQNMNAYVSPNSLEYDNLVYRPQASNKFLLVGDGYTGGSADNGVYSDDGMGTEPPLENGDDSNYGTDPDYSGSNDSGYDANANENYDGGYSNDTGSSYNDGNDSGYNGNYGNTNDGYYDVEEYKITIGTVQVSDVQVRNAISKAVRDCIYGNMGLMTTLNNGKKLNIKTGF